MCDNIHETSIDYFFIIFVQAGSESVLRKVNHGLALLTFKPMERSSGPDPMPIDINGSFSVAFNKHKVRPSLKSAIRNQVLRFLPLTSTEDGLGPYCIFHASYVLNGNIKYTQRQILLPDLHTTQTK